MDFPALFHIVEKLLILVAEDFSIRFFHFISFNKYNINR